LLLAGICFVSLASQVFIHESEETEISGPHTANWTGVWLWQYGRPAYSYITLELLDNCLDVLN